MDTLSGDRTLNEPLPVHGGGGGVFLHVVAEDHLGTLSSYHLVSHPVSPGVG